MSGVTPTDTGSGGGADDMAGGKRSRWMTHVKKTMRANKGKSLAQVLKMAKKTYKKTRRGGNVDDEVLEGGGVASTASPLDGGRRRRRGSRKSKKGSRKH
jgi:hypothetical protein